MNKDWNCEKYCNPPLHWIDCPNNIKNRQNVCPMCHGTGFVAVADRTGEVDYDICCEIKK